MEHELFQSKLKPSVEGTLVPEIVRSSSSGLDSHRTAAVELLFERSIQERRERMFMRMRNSLRPDPTPPSKEISEESIIPTPEVKPTAPQLPQCLPSDASVPMRPRSTPINHETPRGPSKPTRKTKTARFEVPPVNARVNSSPPKDVVQLLCRICGTRQSRNHHPSGAFCGACFGNMSCTGCGTFRISDAETCTNCYRESS